jgi:hypothetical protein
MKIKPAHILTVFIILAAAALLTQSRSAGNGFEINAKHAGKLKLFILAGQSNMSGKGGLPRSMLQTHPNIYAFGNDYQWQLAVEPVDSAIGQVDKVSEDEGAGSSPSVAFAAALAEKYPDMAIGLIPCAKSGSSIREWQRNLSVTSLYGSCLRRARLAAHKGEIAGLLFFQGEQDGLASPTPENWDREFAVFVASWRRDLNQPELPVVFAQIGKITVPKYAVNWNIIQERQRAVRLPFCKMITTDDLALKDAVHFTAQSYKIIGQRFAAAYLELMAGK